MEEPQAYKAAIAVAGYEDFLRTTVKGLLPEGDAQSKKVQKLLDTTLPEVFARKLRMRGVSPSSLSPLLMGSPAYVALPETLFKAFFNCNQRAMLRSLKDKCAGWMLPQLAEAKEKDKEKTSPGYVYTKVEQLPRFPGGEAALLSYIGRNIKYPQSALENEIQGTVLLRFIVLEDGRIGDVEVLRRLDPACDKEAVRVVKGFPRFIPGKFKGKPVKVWYSLPIRFQIQ